MWPSDDELRELEGDQDFTDDGRKVSDAEHVGAKVPDADADPENPRPMRPRHRSRR